MDLVAELPTAVAALVVGLALLGLDSPLAFSAPLMLLGIGHGFLVPPSLAYTADPSLKVSPWWLVFVYLFHTVGELCLSPVGLSTVSKLAPKRYAGSEACKERCGISCSFLP